MSASLEPTNREDIPPPSVELDALCLMVEAYIEAEGPVKGQALLSAAARIMVRREQADAVIAEFGPTMETAERARVRRQTKAWFRRSLPLWLDKLALRMSRPKPPRSKPRLVTRQSPG